jgi:hypothetical protein
VQKISVAPEFEWSCPLCGVGCGYDALPVYVDTFIRNIMKAHVLSNTPSKRSLQITSDGQICCDESSDEEMDETKSEQSL